jgi:hypothetical protein
MVNARMIAGNGHRAWNYQTGWEGGPQAGVGDERTEFLNYLSPEKLPQFRRGHKALRPGVAQSRRQKDWEQSGLQAAWLAAILPPMSAPSLFDHIFVDSPERRG